MTSILGHNYIGGRRSANGNVQMQSLDATTGEPLPARFFQASEAEVDAAFDAALAEAWEAMDKGQAERLLPLCEELLAARGLTAAAIIPAAAAVPPPAPVRVRPSPVAHANDASLPPAVPVAAVPPAPSPMPTLTDRAVAWIEQQRPERPFFLYFPHYAVHGPFNSDPRFDEYWQQYHARFTTLQRQAACSLPGTWSCQSPTLIRAGRRCRNLISFAQPMQAGCLLTHLSRSERSSCK